MDHALTHRLKAIAPRVFINSSNTIVADSRDVAEYFGKEHKNVLRDIEALDCSDEFRKLNFEPTTEYVKVGAQFRTMRYYEMTKDGFSFLAMGFTGAKAGHFKESFIAQYNRFEAEAKSKAPTIPTSMTEALRLALDQSIMIDQQRLQIEADAPKVAVAKLVQQNSHI